MPISLALTQVHSGSFLNKMDIFKEKLLTSPISAHFPDYKGADGDFNAAREYFKQRFMKLNRSASKEVYCKWHLLPPGRHLLTVCLHSFRSIHDGHRYDSA